MRLAWCSAMKAPFPHVYTVDVTRTGHGTATIDASPRSPIRASRPPEFGGEPTLWSPEHLLLSSVGMCLLATFEAFAERAKLAILDWHDTIRGTIDKTANGLAFTSIAVDIELVVAAADVDSARELFDRAKPHCIVSNTLKVPPTITLQVKSA